LFFNAITGPFWVVYGINEIELTTIEWGVIMLMISVLRVGLSIPAGLLVDRFGKRRTLITALTFTIFPVFLFVYCQTFPQTLMILGMIPIANTFLTPSCSSLLADIVPRERRGRVMAALGQGSLFIRAQGGLTGGPGLGFLLTLPVIVGSLLGGYIYSYNPILPWVLFSLALVSCLVLTTVFITEPKQPER
jgi:MFS family permease